mmetsp:Transcript_14522/g.31596  ORF Transcript_14522/g.31596 Transcript_14522/m.31596 type:complete len:133 (+) Transcript_14522:108-506(+)|eukprot:CAMPEP_0202899686 /NCGR_PEP_ID=MMETSP1392-20130828/7855_1 /ASSEMBLY_ACC=CAM_ASM_000868 /TAXON_ID=225041 /ORGANISM="Chlamydomonas chlamydogama, Strain SAG 11-48b" /LENGTH=132 /DNA_ID=CAMNT_0049585935 /DNA_START=103 /DNA_END=501 /DNA_ORIENTATION=-
MVVVVRSPTAAASGKASAALLEQLGKSLESQGESIAAKVKGIVVFKIDDDDWTLDLRPDSTASPRLYRGVPKGGDKADLTLTVNDTNFAQLVMGKLNPQQAFLMRKIKIAGSMGMAMKLQPILDAAQPKSKL